MNDMNTNRTPDNHDHDSPTISDAPLPNEAVPLVTDAPQTDTTDTIEAASNAPAINANTRSFEDLTLAEMLGALVRAPRQTLSALAVVTAPVKRERITIPAVPMVTVPAATAGASGARRATARTADADLVRQGVRLAAYGLAILIAWWANYGLIATPPGIRFGLPDVPFSSALPFLLLSIALIFAGELFANLPGLTRWLSNRGASAGSADSTVSPAHEIITPTVDLVVGRLPILAIALLFGAGAYFFNSDNQFTFLGVLTWFISIALVIVTFTPRGWTLFTAVRAWLSPQRLLLFPRQYPATFFSLLFIMALASYTRLEHLDKMLPEMTSDHVEKLLDAQDVSDGNLRVFMPENGGREIAHFYLLALIDKIPGVTLDFMALKILAALEGILTIPLFWWLGRELIGLHGSERDRRLANAVGIAFALVGALAYWHIQLSRISLRIALTPLVASLLLVYLVRCIRYNRRGDFIMAGLVLGFGLYTYQAVRIMPLLVIAGLMLAILFNARTWRLTRAYLLNFVVLVIVAFMAYMPLFRYSVEYPEFFWSRATGRLLGEDFVTVTNELGQVNTIEATLQDRLDALGRNLPILGQNVVNALLMFNYRGDVIYLHNSPTYPHLDPLLAAFLLAGAAGWFVWMVRRREAVDWLVPIGIAILLIPTITSIAQPNENPSATRASGALPLVLFLAGYGVATVYVSAADLLPKGTRRLFGTLAAAVLIFFVYSRTAWVLFEPYRIVYFQSWHPISHAGDIMRGFSESGGAYGNVWVMRFPYWWDYRAIAIEGGLAPGTWRNGDLSLEELPRYLSDSQRGSNRYPLDVDKDLLFFYHKDDVATETQFRAWFPEGYTTYYEAYLPELDESSVSPGIRYPNKDFKTYRVPALGADRFEQFFIENGVR